MSESAASRPVVTTVGVEHTGLMVRDPLALSTWYREVFGATEVSRSDGDPPIIFLGFGRAALLELVPTGDTALAAPQDHVHLCLAVPSLDAALASLRSNGIALHREPFAAYDGSMVTFLKDPEGNLIQLVERIAGSSIDRTVFS